MECRVWVWIPLETYIFILIFCSLPARSEQFSEANANEIKHDHSPDGCIRPQIHLTIQGLGMYNYSCSIPLRWGRVSSQVSRSIHAVFFFFFLQTHVVKTWTNNHINKRTPYVRTITFLKPTNGQTEWKFCKLCPFTPFSLQNFGTLSFKTAWSGHRPPFQWFSSYFWEEGNAIQVNHMQNEISKWLTSKAAGTVNEQGRRTTDDIRLFIRFFSLVW